MSLSIIENLHLAVGQIYSTDWYYDGSIFCLHPTMDVAMVLTRPTVFNACTIERSTYVTLVQLLCIYISVLFNMYVASS